MLPIIYKIPILKAFAVRPRLMTAFIAGAVAVFAMPDKWSEVTKAIMAWDIGIVLYLILAAMMMYGSKNSDIRMRAKAQDEGGMTILCLTIFGACVSIAAILHELATAKALSGHTESAAIVLAGATVVLSWMFMQTIFAIHYAHEYYSPDKGSEGGLEFPKGFTTPDYWDFVYYSFVIGTAAATADINITSRTIRRITTLHCIVVFFFNTSILALAINIGASLAS